MRSTNVFQNCLAIVAVALAAGGCGTIGPPSPGGAGPGDRPEAAADGVPAPQRELPTELPLPEVSEALLPSFADRFVEPPAVEEPRFDLAVKGAPAREFFLNLVADTPYEIIVHPEVKGTISLTLKDATIPEILDAVREAYGYEFRPRAKGYFALPARPRSRVFQVDYLHAQRSGRSQTRVSSGQLSEQFGDSRGGANSTGDRATGGDRARELIESSMVKTDSATDFWAELAASLRAIVGADEGRSVVVSPQAGVVVVRAMPAELRQVDEFLSRTQANLRRQVILEAKILEVELNDGFRAGINWAVLIEWGGKSILAAQTGGATLLGEAGAALMGTLGTSDIGGNTGNLDPDNLSQVSNTDTSAFGGVFSAALDLNHFTGFIELLEGQGRVHVLSSPRISTLNGQKAVIKVGSDEFFVTDVSSNTIIGSSATTTTPNIELTPFFSGIALDVMPQISESGDVILHIHPSVSQVQDQQKVIQVADETLTLPLAFSTIRESDSIVRARSGQVIVIGGLMQDLAADNRASNPILGRIPFLGALFRQTLIESRKSELVILLRPTVVGETTWSEERMRLERRLGQPPYEIEPGLLLSGEEGEESGEGEEEGAGS